MTRRRACTALLTLAAAALLSACGAAGGSGRAGHERAPGTQTLTIAATSGPLSLDPTLSGNGVPETWYSNLAYAPLIQREPDGRLDPGLATTWGYSRDRLAFTMHLRRGVRFSDGTALTASGVVAWLEYYEKDGNLTEWLAGVKRISATGPFTVRLTLSAPNPLLTYGFDQDGMAGDVVGARGLADPAILGDGTDGAGPYMLDAHQTIAGSQYVYVKNPHYDDPSAQHYAKVVIKVISDENSVLAALRSHEVQVAEGAASYAASARSAGLDVEAAPSALVGVCIGDIDGRIVPALRSTKVREALSLAIDRTGITRALYGRYATATDQGVPSTVAGYVSGLASRLPYDPERARALLAQAGYPHGFALTLIEQPAVDDGDLLAQAVLADWSAIGVRATIKTTESFADYVPLIKSERFPATTFTFQYSNQLVETEQLVGDPALYNWMGFHDPTALRLIADESRYPVGSTPGRSAARAAERFLTDNGDIIAVSSTDALLFSSRDVTGVANRTYPWSDPVDWTPTR